MTTYRERHLAGHHSSDPAKREAAAKKAEQQAKASSATAKASKS